MKTYSKATFVQAEQFKPTDAEKASLTKKAGENFNPATLWGDTLKKRTEGEKVIFYVTTPVPGERILIEDGQWLVKEDGKVYVETDEDFKAKYSEVKEKKVKKEKVVVDTDDVKEDEDPTGAVLN